MEEKSAKIISLGNCVTSSVNEGLFDMKRKIIERIKAIMEIINRNIFGFFFDSVFLSLRLSKKTFLFFVKKDTNPNMNVATPARMFTK